MSNEVDITRLLNEAARGDLEAAREVFPAIYQELRELAAAKRSRLPRGGTLQTTALVHEAYLRIVERNEAGWECARHFYFTAARAMQDILVEDARRKASLKRGGDQERVEFESEELTWTFDISPDDVLSLDGALSKLAERDVEAYRLVLLYFYSGLTFAEIAEMLGANLRTIERRWRFVRTWLAREMEAPAV